mgnify:FL=1|tara:strand:+ start:871 stop:1167 length:297 start_codon:yes stop_codon:yes gene_type:complete
MPRLSDNDLFDAAVMIEEAYEIDIHKDIIFSNDLNAYYNCTFNHKTDEITFNVEVDEGSAQFYIKDYFNECEISCNWTACDYVNRIEMNPIKDIPLYE